MTPTQLDRLRAGATPDRSELLEYLRQSPRSCTEVGEFLWGDRNTSRGKRQAWARPAGKLLRRLQKEGLVFQCYDDFRKHIFWRAV